MRKFLVLLAMLIGFALTGATQPVFPEGFAYSEIISGLESVSTFCILPDGSILIGKQEGEIYHFKEGMVSPNPTLSIPTIAGADRGLVGIAADPDFSENHYIYCTYTLEDNSHNRVSRFQLQAEDHSDEHDHIEFLYGELSSEEVIVELSPLRGPWHAGGAIVFDSKGYMFVTTGDNSTPDNAQDLSTTHGKVLRLHKDGSIPTDNPFYHVGGSASMVWGYGLRNPYTMTINPNNDRIFINDVGKDSWEEINDASEPGRNFGWPLFEGSSNGGDGLTDPVYTYYHTKPFTSTTGSSITGGAFYVNSEVYPEKYHNKYFFIDLGGSWINVIDPNNPATPEVFATNLQRGPIYLTQGLDGFLYYFSRQENILFRVEYHTQDEPYIVQQPKSQRTLIGERTRFIVSATGKVPLSYQWYKDGNPIKNATSSVFSFSNTQATRVGNYSVKITNSFGSVTSEPASLQVYSLEDIPNVEIVYPSPNSLYSAGDTLLLVAKAFDQQDGEISPSSFTWWADFHHDTHAHDGPPIQEGSDRATYIVPDIGETSSNVWFNFRAVVEDSDGYSSTANIIIYPRTSTLTFETVPPGLNVSVDGPLYEAPKTFEFVEGLRVNVTAPAPQYLNDDEDIAYYFNNWSTGADKSHLMTVPDEDYTLIANYDTCSQVPEQPTTLTGSFVTEGDFKISLSWGKTSCSGSYVLEKSLNQTFDEVLSAAETSKTSVDDYEFISDTTYFYRLRAVNVFGSSQYSDVVEVVVPKVSLDAPQNLRLIPIDSISCFLFWEDVTQEEEFLVIVSKEGDIGDPAKYDTFQILKNQTKAYITSLEDETAYYFSAIAKLRNLTSHPATIHTALQFNPDVTLKAPQNVDLTSHSDADSMTLNWELDEIVEGYQVLISSSVNFDREVDLLEIEDGSLKQVSMARPDDENLYYKVRSVSAAAYSEFSAICGTNTPRLVENGDLLLSEGNEASITPDILSVSDLDSPSDKIIYTIKKQPRYGRLLLNAEQSDSFTQEDVEKGSLKYFHSGDEQFVDSFRFSVTDGLNTLVTTTKNIVIAPINDNVPYAEQRKMIEVTEGDSIVLTAEHLLISDGDGPVADSLQIKIVGYPLEGYMSSSSEQTTDFSYQDILDGSIKYTHNDTESFSDSLMLRVNDGENEFDVKISIKIIPKNDHAPVVNTTEPMELPQGGEVFITRESLSVRDEDIDTEPYTLTVRVVEPAVGGHVLLEDITANVFSMQDIEDGKVKYKHSGGEGLSDSLMFTVSDGTHLTAVNKLKFSLTPSVVSGIEYSELDDIIYPNPSEGILFFKLKTHFEQFVQVTVYDLSGNIIMSKRELTADDFSINLQDQESQVVIIEISDTKTKRFYRLVKK